MSSSSASSLVFGSGSIGYESFAWRGAPMSDRFFVYAPSTLIAHERSSGTCRKQVCFGRSLAANIAEYKLFESLGHTSNKVHAF